MLIVLILSIPIVFMAIGIFIFLFPKKKSDKDPKIIDLFYAETKDSCRTVTEMYGIIEDIKKNGGEYLKNKKKEEK